jgi:peptidoglycan/xylan/chitin deacetylase (PgdA/CDA1 family)
MLTALLGVATGGAALLAHGALVPNSPLFGPVVGRGPRERVLYLTFDDGPNPHTTERIVHLLERERVPATFFMVGSHAEQFPRLARLVAQAGFGVGNHTHTHTRLALAGPARTAWEVNTAHAAIERAVREALARGVSGPELTPWLLARIAELTDGASVRANTALIVNNARVAGQLAVRVARAGAG